MKKYPSQERLLELFTYDQGILVRKVSSRFSKNQGAKAGGLSGRYLSTSVDGVPYYVHKLIYIMFHAVCPPLVDHVNRNRFDNRIENLRPLTNAQNRHNQTGRKDRTTKYKGVCKSTKGSQTFRAFIGFGGRVIYLGSFKTQELAASAYNEAAVQYHKEYAVLNDLS
jgi:hypothetical protein